MDLPSQLGRTHTGAHLIATIIRRSILSVSRYIERRLMTMARGSPLRRSGADDKTEIVSFDCRIGAFKKQRGAGKSAIATGSVIELNERRRGSDQRCVCVG